jgi:hypothetical protein
MVTIEAENQAATCSDQTDSVNVNAGDTLAVQMVVVSAGVSGGGGLVMNVSLEKQ